MIGKNNLNYTAKVYLGDVVKNLDKCIEKINDIESVREGCFSGYPLGYDEVLQGINLDWQVLPQIKHEIETRGEICYLEHQLKKFGKDSNLICGKDRKELFYFLKKVHGNFIKKK